MYFCVFCDSSDDFGFVLLVSFVDFSFFFITETTDSFGRTSPKRPTFVDWDVKPCSISISITVQLTLTVNSSTTVPPRREVTIER